MSNGKIFFACAICILLFTGNTSAQEPYSPPPSGINYHNDTLTIYPPDSIPGDPVVLLGYNILVDNIFYDNIMVENQTDTVDFIFNYSTLYPGNHEFCVNTFYNEWISDPLCDSGLVIYGYELPFLEDWSSGNFTENNWTTESGNWTVEAEEGNPGPAAVFSGLPAQYNYEIPLESYAFRGNQMHLGRFFFSFDLKLNSNSNSGNEKLCLQVWNWNDKFWETWGIYSNQAGSFEWTSKSIYINSASSGLVIKIRFLATGLISSNISGWMIDNVNLMRRCMSSDCAQVEEFYDHNTLYWSPPSGCYPSGLEWDDGVNSGNSIGTGSEVIFDVAARWDANQISAYNGEQIHAVSFFPAESWADYRIRIWKGDSAEVLVYEKVVENPLINQWNEIELDTLVFIDGEQDLWIGYHIEAQSGYPAGVDDGPAINGYGNMIFWEDKWQTLLDVNPDLDYNWNIKGILHPYPEPPEIFYNIYREVNSSGSYDFLDQTDEWPYEDYNIIPEDIHCYLVTNLWIKDGDTCESLPSNEACENIYTGFNHKTSPALIKIYPNPTSDILHIESGETMKKIRLSSLLGELVSEFFVNEENYLMDVSGFQDGIYFVEVETITNRFNEKVLILK
jgi:hypothetical protein